MNTCLHCGQSIFHRRFCNWDCHVEYTLAHGGVKQCPNDLPVRCIRHDGVMLECEHGDHPDYKFPVEAKFIGKDNPDNLTTETYALIYTDGYIAITLYEFCYAMWYLSDGSAGGGSLGEVGNWQLTPDSVEKIKSYAIRTGRMTNE